MPNIYLKDMMYAFKRMSQEVAQEAVKEVTRGNIDVVIHDSDITNEILARSLKEFIVVDLTKFRKLYSKYVVDGFVKYSEISGETASADEINCIIDKCVCITNNYIEDLTLPAMSTWMIFEPINEELSLKIKESGMFYEHPITIVAHPSFTKTLGAYHIINDVLAHKTNISVISYVEKHANDESSDAPSDTPSTESSDAPSTESSNTPSTSSDSIDPVKEARELEKSKLVARYFLTGLSLQNNKSGTITEIIESLNGYSRYEDVAKEGKAFALIIQANVASACFSTYRCVTDGYSIISVNSNINTTPIGNVADLLITTGSAKETDIIIVYQFNNNTNTVMMNIWGVKKNEFCSLHNITASNGRFEHDNSKPFLQLLGFGN